MEPGPIPPHERTWRHPSELGPTSSEVDDSAAKGRQTAALAIGSSLIVLGLVAMMVVASTHRTASGPVAISSTSIAIAEPAEPSDERAPLFVTFVRIPNEIASPPAFASDPPVPATALPDATDPIVVETPEATYHCAWNAIRQIEMPDGSLVFNDRGELVAYSDGRTLVIAVDD